MSIMSLIKMQIPTGYSVDMFLLFSWFGDYRGLRFLCVYFGRRTFLLEEIKMFCDFCGKQLNEDSKFCPYCGKKVNIIREMKEKESIINTEIEATEQTDSSNISSYNNDCVVQELETIEENYYDIILYGVGSFKMFAKVFINIMSNKKYSESKNIFNNLPVTLFSKINENDAKKFINYFTQFNLKLGYVKTSENTFGKQVANMDIAEFENKIAEFENKFNIIYSDISIDKKNDIKTKKNITKHNSDNTIIDKTNKKQFINMVIDIIAIVVGIIGCVLFIFSPFYSFTSSQIIDGESVYKSVQYSNFERIIWPPLKAIFSGKFRLTLNVLVNSFCYIFIFLIIVELIKLIILFVKKVISLIKLLKNGTNQENTYDNNFDLMKTAIMMTLYIVYASFFNDIVSKTVIIIAILMIIGLLYQIIKNKILYQIIKNKIRSK